MKTRWIEIAEKDIVKFIETSPISKTKNFVI